MASRTPRKPTRPSEDPMRLMATLMQATFGLLVSKHTVNNLLDDPGVMGISEGAESSRSDLGRKRSMTA